MSDCSLASHPSLIPARQSRDDKSEPDLRKLLQALEPLANPELRQSIQEGLRLLKGRKSKCSCAWVISLVLSGIGYLDRLNADGGDVKRCVVLFLRRQHGLTLFFRNLCCKGV